MKKIFYMILIFTSCNTKKTDTAVSKEISGAGNENPETAAIQISSGCYRMIIDKDSAHMDLSVNGKEVSGDLNYKRFQKDSNKGSFNGTIDSNKLVAWYKFQSEGMISVRQVIFKLTDKGLAEGYGDLEVKGDTAYFKYPHTLTFEESHPFTKVDCK